MIPTTPGQFFQDPVFSSVDNGLDLVWAEDEEEENLCESGDEENEEEEVDDELEGDTGAGGENGERDEGEEKEGEDEVEGRVSGEAKQVSFPDSQPIFEEELFGSEPELLANHSQAEVIDLLESPGKCDGEEGCGHEKEPSSSSLARSGTQEVLEDEAVKEARLQALRDKLASMKKEVTSLIFG